MHYLIILTAAGRRLSDHTFALESAFADHLRAMLKALGPRFDEMVVAMGEMRESAYEEWRPSLSVIDEEAERIRFVPLFTWRSSHAQFVKELPHAVRVLTKLVHDADLVHSHPTYDLYRPVENIATALALAMGKKVIAVCDMDNRRDADMNFRLGRWSRKSYLACKYLYDPIRDVTQRAYARFCDLLLYKEPQQVEDYGKGAPSVRFFLDPNYHEDDIADDALVERKIATLADPKAPLRVLYFGRLVPYKGVREMVEAVIAARARGANLTFDIMGTGSEKAALHRLVEEHGAGDVIHFLQPRPYGPAFFEVLRARHLLLACPLSADTPRSTWDALASAMPVLAFDTPFYRGIGKYTGAVEVVPWPDIQALAARIGQIAADKKRLGPMMNKAVAAARANTGDAWLEKRVAWIDELFAGDELRSVPPGADHSSVGNDVNRAGGAGMDAGISSESGAPSSAR